MSSSQFNTDIFYQAGGDKNKSTHTESDTKFTLSQNKLNKSVENSVSVNSYLFSTKNSVRNSTDCTDTVSLASKLTNIHQAVLNPGFMGGKKMSEKNYSTQSGSASSSKRSHKDVQSSSLSNSSSSSSPSSVKTNSSSSSSNKKIHYSLNYDDMDPDDSSITLSTVAIPANLTASMTTTDVSNTFEGGYNDESSSSYSVSSTTSRKKDKQSTERHLIEKQLNKQFRK